MKNNNFKKFILLWLGELISTIGSGLTNFGLGVYVFNKTGSASYTALITLIGFLPMFLLSVPAGVLADRYDRRILLIISDGMSALGVLFILICMLNGEATIWQICIGIFISSVFSSLLEPSYKASITDLLSKKDYSKASGLVSLAGSSKYLFSPIIAGFLLSISNINLILIIDILTFFITFLLIMLVRKEMKNTQNRINEKFGTSLKAGWNIIKTKKNIMTLIVISSIITLFIGTFQVLIEPLILTFTDSKILGIVETICACGMLISSVIIGVLGIKNKHIKILSLSIFFSGLFMIGIGTFEKISIITLFGFLFFSMLPFANASLDYLTRISIPDDLQGRIWGIIGFISQLGYIVAYGISGILADLLGGFLGSVGRGAALMIQISGFLLLVTSIIILFQKSLINNIKN